MLQALAIMHERLARLSAGPFVSATLSAVITSPSHRRAS
jgi:hypothetical protein